MTETTPDNAAAQRAAEQARLRKERREAKIRAGGSSRLDKITGLGGRTPDSETAPTNDASPDPAAPAKAATAATSPAPAGHADPEEVDISQHYYEPSSTPRVPGAADPNAWSEAQLRQMMLGFDRPVAGGPGPGPGPGPAPNPLTQQEGQQPANPFAAAAAGLGAEDDPMMKMLSQMMAAGGPGGGPGAGGFPGMGEGAGGGGFPGFPGMAGMPGMPGQAASPPRSSAGYTWRIIHALFALALGLYIALTTYFSGSFTQRERVALAFSYPTANDETVDTVHAMEQGREVFFWMFATAEALLITTKFLMEKGRPDAEAGMLWSLTGFLPGPWKGRAETALRYGQVFSSVRRDILFCIFVLGVAAWWRG